MEDTPQVKATLELRGKAAVSVMTTTDATAASPLSTYGVAGEALQLIRGASSARSKPMRRVPFRTKVARARFGTGGAWVGKAWRYRPRRPHSTRSRKKFIKPPRSFLLSDELLRIGDPDAERTVTDTVVAGVAAYLDAQFFDEHRHVKREPATGNGHTA